jgi:hypothetical protein
MVVGDAEMLTARSVYPRTSVELVAELLTKSRSICGDVTPAMLLAVPGVVGVTLIVIMALVLLVRVPSAQVTSPPLWVQLPRLLAAFTKVMPVATRFVTVTFVKKLRVKLVTTIV